jgi:hypothetical protein
LPGFPIGFLLLSGNPLIALPVWGASLYACALGARWHREDLDHGADHAEIARARPGIVGLIRRRQAEVAIKDRGWISDGQLIVGRDERGLTASIPVGYDSGSHTLVVGATGSGKTVSEAWIVCRLIDGLHGAIVIDPKGDAMLREELRASAERLEESGSSNGRRMVRSRTTPTRTARTPRSLTRRSRARSSPSPATCARPSVTSDTRSGSCMLLES